MNQLYITCSALQAVNRDAIKRLGIMQVLQFDGFLHGQALGRAKARFRPIGVWRVE
ncbi:MAG: hypothetical protein AAF911_08255 [Planctomycetota bacterium]